MAANTTKQAWVTPKLEALDIEKTLTGPIDAYGEGVYTDGPFTGEPNTNGSLAS